MDDLIEYIKGLPWKDLSGPLITGLLALSGIQLTLRERKKNSVEQRRLETEKLKRDEDGRQQVANQTFNIAQTQDLTERFKALMDGYESRIEDLTGALVAQTTENRTLRQEFDVHRAICRRCPHYAEIVNAS